ncbi:histidine kinase [Aureisphaera galaxeae]|uniref:sensor histidine kinase n=1 Tax=Aureisphaera galaxeae TaxID=1538023 RepID=UPI002350967B|nr:histidine kinase [Aureisphaera galaxeae]MDC8002723.1 histidine kinase [Aureisphaera galaxeae]
MKKKGLQKIAVRFLIVNVVYFLIKLTIDHGGKAPNLFSGQAVFYYSSAIVLFFSTWEINDRLIKKYQERRGALSPKDYTAIIGWTMAIMTPLAALYYYIGIFHLNHICHLHDGDPWLQWRIDFFRAMLLSVAVILFNVFYHALYQKRELENKMTALKKEVVTSKYKSLKSQISPHFLFNSLNTLTSLMYEDRDLASDFVSRLASCYRYILDNREEDLVSLEKELGFLDSFMFMMNVRHEGALTIKTNIKVSPVEYLIPTLTLQMLVENAMKHNFYSKEKPMEILVETRGKQRLVVQNTFRKRALEEESTGLGIQNVKNRYAFYTSQEVLVEEKEDVFVVEIPLLPRDIKDIKMIVS